MSVSLAEHTNSVGRGPADVLQGHDGYGLAQITAGLVRAYEQGVQRDAQPEDPAHALVFGKKSNAARRAFSKECQWVVAPPKND
ncbi:hypothetical protein [Schlesneria sp.]|uniref:hypothetical protein n=1 Tax=Schlesneria sp. TaxID=2762018 RepID=UPI002F031CAF